MRSRSPRGPLLDMAENLHLAQEFVGDRDYQAFYDDRRTLYAVIRSSRSFPKRPAGCRMS
jgi:uncharacterized protein with HEPN domain